MSCPAAAPNVGHILTPARAGIAQILAALPVRTAEVLPALTIAACNILTAPAARIRKVLPPPSVGELPVLVFGLIVDATIIASVVDLVVLDVPIEPAIVALLGKILFR
jgi:hypothetical protein